MPGELLLDTEALVTLLDRSQPRHEVFVRFFGGENALALFLSSARLCLVQPGFIASLRPRRKGGEQHDRSRTTSEPRRPSSAFDIMSALSDRRRDRWLSDRYHGVEVNLSGRTFGRYHTVSRSWRPEPVLTHPLKVQLDTRLNAAQGRVERLSSCHASRQVGNRCAPVAIGFLADADEILKLPHCVSH